MEGGESGGGREGRASFLPRGRRVFCCVFRRVEARRGWRWLDRRSRRGRDGGEGACFVLPFPVPSLGFFAFPFPLQSACCGLRIVSFAWSRMVSWFRVARRPLALPLPPLSLRVPPPPRPKGAGVAREGGGRRLGFPAPPGQTRHAPCRPPESPPPSAAPLTNSPLPGGEVGTLLSHAMRHAPCALRPSLSPLSPSRPRLTSSPLSPLSLSVFLFPPALDHVSSSYSVCSRGDRACFGGCAGWRCERERDVAWLVGFGFDS